MVRALYMEVLVRMSGLPKNLVWTLDLRIS